MSISDNFLEVWIYKHIDALNDIEYNLYLELRNRGLDHWNSLVRIYNYDRWCKGCDRIVALQEHEDRTCYQCSGEAALRG